LVAVDSVAAPASSQFGASPFLPDGPLYCPSSPEPSGSTEDDNFDSSIPPPDDCHMASNDDSSAFDYPYGDSYLPLRSLSSITLIFPTLALT
jgi:hypothetical protein